MPPRRARGRPRSAEVDEAVLLATVELAGEVGVSRLSMDDVAVRAKVSKATIYRRWASKEALVLDALRAAMVPIEDDDTGSLPRRPRALSQRARQPLPQRQDARRPAAPDRCGVPRRQPAVLARRLHADAACAAAVDPGTGAGAGRTRPDIDLDVLIDVILGPFAYRKLLARAPIDEEFVVKLLAIVLPNLR